MSTQWKAIEGYEGIYEVSDAGQVKSLERRVQYTLPNGTEASRSHPERILRPCPTPNGYLQVSLALDGVYEKLYIHRLIAKAFLPNRKEEVNHINGDKTDNRVENLEWSTRMENMHHALANGLNRYAKRFEGYAIA